MILIFTFLMFNDVERLLLFYFFYLTYAQLWFITVEGYELLLMCLLVLCISPLEKYLFKSFAHFLNWGFNFLLLSFKSSLYILP